MNASTYVDPAMHPFNGAALFLCMLIAAAVLWGVWNAESRRQRRRYRDSLNPKCPKCHKPMLFTIDGRLYQRRCDHEPSGRW